VKVKLMAEQQHFNFLRYFFEVSRRAQIFKKWMVLSAQALVVEQQVQAGVINKST
jgi:hypothetical protein